LHQEHAVSEIEITYFSDVLCVWAYVAQARIEAVKEKFGTSVRIEQRFCSVFGDTATKIASTWKDRGRAFAKCGGTVPHIVVHPEIWLSTRPPSSASPHLFMKAVQHWECQSAVAGQSAVSVFDRVVWTLRCAFFRDCRDIARWNVQCEIGEGLGVDIGAIEQLIDSGVAFARPAADYQDARCGSKAVLALCSMRGGRSSTEM
jgi:protein-disulfide isomerase-like protein with CxxC motif